MPTFELELPPGGNRAWAGHGHYRLISPSRRQIVRLRYVGEPPHGDSYHQLHVDDAALPGFVWGCEFALSADEQFLAASWMAQPFERRTIIIDVATGRYTVLPVYIPNFIFDGDRLIDLESKTAYKTGELQDWTKFGAP